jgi:hypothetical protein
MITENAPYGWWSTNYVAITPGDALLTTLSSKFVQGSIQDYLIEFLVNSTLLFADEMDFESNTTYTLMGIGAISKQLEDVYPNQIMLLSTP